MSLEHILLGMLRDPASGYELRQAFGSGPRHFWSAELGQIYPALQAMERRRLLASRAEASAKGPPRRVYARTAKGTAALRTWLKGDPQLGTERLAYIGQLVFLAELGDARRTEAFVDTLRRRLDAFRAKLSAAEQSLRQSAGMDFTDWSDDDFHELLCLRIGVRSIEGKIAGCEECIRLARQRRATRKRRRR